MNRVALNPARLADVFREISFRPNETFGPHSHHRLEVNYVKKGTCRIVTKTIRQKFGRGDLMVIPSEVDHRFEAGRYGATLIQLEFIPEIFSNIAPVVDADSLFINENGASVMTIRSDVRIRSVMQNIIWELQNRQNGYIEAVVALYTQLWILLHRAQINASCIQSLSPSVSHVVKIIESLSCKPMSVSDIADAAGISTRYLRRIIQNQFHTTPSKYLATMRVEKSKEMLANTDLTVKEIAFACGFSSPRRYIESFTRIEGYPPARRFSRE